jgi:hypothetical protein
MAAIETDIASALFAREGLHSPTAEISATANAVLAIQIAAAETGKLSFARPSCFRPASRGSATRKGAAGGYGLSPPANEMA